MNTGTMNMNHPFALRKNKPKTNPILQHTGNPPTAADSCRTFSGPPAPPPKINQSRTRFSKIPQNPPKVACFSHIFARFHPQSARLCAPFYPKIRIPGPKINPNANFPHPFSPITDSPRPLFSIKSAIKKAPHRSEGHLFNNKQQLSLKQTKMPDFRGL